MTKRTNDYVQNSAQKAKAAFEKVRKAFEGEAQRQDLHTVDDVVKLIHRVREDNDK